MEGAVDPTVQRRRLSLALKKARSDADMKQSDVAQAMDWSPSKVIRIESGQVSISTNDLKQLLTHYEIQEPSFSQLLDLARLSRGASFYQQYEDLLEPGFRKFLAYESSSSVIQHLDLVVISGLLQTEEYALAIMEDVAEASPNVAARGWEVRKHRQELHDRDDPPRMYFLIDEAAVRRNVGRRDHVMQHQLERLREFGRKSHVTIQIIPFAQGAYPGMAGNFTMLEFKDPHLDDLVYLESHNDLLLRDDIKEIGHYGDKFKQLQTLALSSEDSEVMIQEIIEQMNR